MVLVLTFGFFCDIILTKQGKELFLDLFCFVNTFFLAEGVFFLFAKGFDIFANVFCNIRFYTDMNNFLFHALPS